MAIPPLAMVLVFTPPAFAIIRDVTSRTNEQLAEGLARRNEQARTALLEEEFYLLESVRFASNIQGIAQAFVRRDAAAVQDAFGSVAALKEDLDVLVATDAAGAPLFELSRPGGATGTVWSDEPIVSRTLGGAPELEAGFASTADRKLVAVGGPVRDGDRIVGAVLAGIDAKTLVAEASRRAFGAVALYDLNGALVAQSGEPALPSRAPRTDGRMTIAPGDAATLALPARLGRKTAGSLAVAVAREPAFALARRVTRNLSLLLFAAVLVGVVLLALLTRFLLAQIRQLVRTNTALGRGELEARAEVMSEDELGNVAEALNTMAAELQTSYEELEHRVDERTRELRVARDVADEATRAKAAFLANMSHEIRTPMNAVIGMTSLMLDTPLSRQQRDYVETIRASGDHLLTIINDILDFSKIEAGHLELELQPFSVRSCVEEALDLVALRASERRVELAYEIDDDVPAGIVGDLGRTRQVLLNLLSNAVKFTERGEVVVSVTGRRIRGHGSEVQVGVRDTGIGIEPAVYDRLFLPFSQIDVSTTRLYGGTGLGLAISKVLVELMGGKIWAESALGKGSTFHFTIRADTVELPAQEPVLTPELSGRRVLVVDDNATNRHVAAGYVRRWGMVPSLAAIPSRALKMIESRPPGSFDLCLLDHDMPEMSGVELATRLRKLDPSLALVLLSSIGRLSGRSGAAFDAMLTKPIKPSQLYDAVVHALAGTPVEQRRVETVAIDSGMGRRHPLRILVAEDNPVNQQVARAVLERLGYKPDFAANGKETVQAIERQPYDVVLMDVQMPEMDGLQATEEIRRRWRRARPRIVAMTANATAEDRRRCLESGMDDYLAKPVTVVKLVDALGRCTPVEYASNGARRTRSRKGAGARRG